jgi:hypothetical protein
MERIWIFLGLFAVFFAIYYRRLRSEGGEGTAVDGMLREAEQRSAIGTLVVASILIVVSAVQGSLLVLLVSLLLFAFGVWRLRNSRGV